MLPPPSAALGAACRHMSLYKFAFSLEDHVKLVKLLFDIFFIDGLDFTYQASPAGHSANVAMCACCTGLLPQP